MDEGLKDILFALLAMAVPIAAAVLDSKRKKDRNAQVKAYPVTEEELRSLNPDSDEDETGDEYGTEDTAEDNIRGSVQPPQEKNAPGASPAISEKPRLSREEKRKLIIYSEIMKPKYDE